MTVIEHLSVIPDVKIRLKALANLENECAKYEVGSLAEAVIEAFLWSKSPEGFAYWLAFYDECVAREAKLYHIRSNNESKETAQEA